MGSKWTWIFAILGLAAFVLGIVFFVVTQTITGRDWATLGIGAVIGGTIAGLIATFVFHADERSTRRAATVEAGKVTAAALEAEKKAKADADRENARKLSDAEADAIRQKAAGEAEALKITATAEASLIAKKAELLSALPTRTERLRELHQEIAITEQNRNEAKGNADAARLQAADAARHNMLDFARQNEENANNWTINVREMDRRLPELTAERDRIQGMTDEEYLQELVHARGLD